MNKEMLDGSGSDGGIDYSQRAQEEVLELEARLRKLMLHIQKSNPKKFEEMSAKIK